MDSHERHKEKRDFVIQWLLAFQFSTPKVICLALGLDRSTQNNFFASLKKTEFFNILPPGLVREKIWILSVDGLRFSDIHFRKPENSYISPSRVVNSTVYHSLSIQISLIKRAKMKPPFAFVYDKYITHIPKGKRPDAIFVKDEKKVALEVELTQKANKRIYLGYLEHVSNLKEGLYSSVEYVFRTEVMKRAYTKRFDAPLWPVFSRAKSGGIQQRLIGGQPEMVDMQDSRIRSLFTFTVEDLY